ncbi:MAG: hypothetical protein NWE99_11100 [Candidatus Bathyarchaeota archaeon]|nr:hypothetical protein [Candidatus Bathyarchaeota archaeon]
MSYVSATPVEKMTRITLNGAIAGQQTRNVYYVGMTTDSWSSYTNEQRILLLAEIALWFRQEIWPKIREFVSVGFAATRVVAVSPDTNSSVEFVDGLKAEQVFNQSGFVSGDVLTPFDSYGVMLFPFSSTLVSRGHKRYAGVAESQQNQGVVNLSGAGPTNGMAQHLADLTASHEVELGGDSIQVRFLIPKTQAYLDQGRKRYRVVGGYWVFNSGLKTTVRSQVTRQYLRGI